MSSDSLETQASSCKHLNVCMINGYFVKLGGTDTNTKARFKMKGQERIVT